MSIFTLQYRKGCYFKSFQSFLEPTGALPDLFTLPLYVYYSYSTPELLHLYSGLSSYAFIILLVKFLCNIVD